MKELVLHVTVPAETADLMAGRLWELGTIAVEERQGAAANDHVVLVAAFPTADAARWAAAEIASDTGGWAAEAVVGVTLVEVEDDWRDAWKQHVDAMNVGDRLRVVPAWRPEDISAGRLSIVLDSGACFGSGTHPTTRTVLTVLEEVVVSGAVVLDVGTGSGILAIAAALLGAGRVDAIDIEPESVPVTAANAEANGVGAVVRPATTALADLAGPYDLVLANVSAGTLAALADDLLRVLGPLPAAPPTPTPGPSPTLALSGMLDGQWRHVAACFAALEVVDHRTVDGWTTVVLRRAQNPNAGEGTS